MLLIFPWGRIRWKRNCHCRRHTGFFYFLCAGLNSFFLFCPSSPLLLLWDAVKAASGSAEPECTLTFISNAKCFSCARVSAALVEGKERWGMLYSSYYQPGWALQCLCLLLRAKGLLDSRSWSWQHSLEANFKGFGGVQLAAIILLVHKALTESPRHKI